MADKTTKEALLLMLGPPMQLASARRSRARREGRRDVEDLWDSVIRSLKDAVDTGTVAAQRDDPIAS